MISSDSKETRNHKEVRFLRFVPGGPPGLKETEESASHHVITQNIAPRTIKGLRENA